MFLAADLKQNIIDGNYWTSYMLRIRTWLWLLWLPAEMDLLGNWSSIPSQMTSWQVRITCGVVFSAVRVGVAYLQITFNDAALLRLVHTDPFDRFRLSGCQDQSLSLVFIDFSIPVRNQSETGREDLQTGFYFLVD